MLAQNILKLEHVGWIAKVRNLLCLTRVLLIDFGEAGSLVLGGRLPKDRLYHARNWYLR